MQIDNETLAIVGAIAGTILTCGLAIMGYFIQKRDDAIDTNATEITKQSELLSAHKLEVAKEYATKTTVIALFQQVTQENKDAIGRVDKRLDETNTGIKEQGQKIDKVIESIGYLQTNVLLKLSEKT